MKRGVLQTGNHFLQWRGGDWQNYSLRFFVVLVRAGREEMIFPYPKEKKEKSRVNTQKGLPQRLDETLGRNGRQQSTHRKVGGTTKQRKERRTVQN